MILCIIDARHEVLITKSNRVTERILENSEKGKTTDAKSILA